MGLVSMIAWPGCSPALDSSSLRGAEPYTEKPAGTRERNSCLQRWGHGAWNAHLRGRTATGRDTPSKHRKGLPTAHQPASQPPTQCHLRALAAVTAHQGAAGLCQHMQRAGQHLIEVLLHFGRGRQWNHSSGQGGSRLRACGRAARQQGKLLSLAKAACRESACAY